MSFDFEHAHKRREQIKQNIEKSYNSNLPNLSNEDLEKSANDFFEKGGKRAVIGERRTFGGREYIKTAQGWKFHGKGIGVKAAQHHEDTVEHHKQAGTKHPHEQSLAEKRNVYNLKDGMGVPEEKQSNSMKKRSKNATDHFIEEDGKHYIDVLDPDTGEKKFKPGDKVHYHDDDGKKHTGIISDREHEDGDMFEVDRDMKDSKKQAKKISQKYLDSVKKMFEESVYMSDTPHDEKINFIEGRIDIEGGSREDAKEIHNHLKDSGFYDKVKKKHQSNRNDSVSKAASSALIHRFMDLESEEAHDNAEEAIKNYLVSKGIDRKHLENEPIMEDMTFHNESGDMSLKQAQKHVKERILPYLDELVEAMKEDGMGVK